MNRLMEHLVEGIPTETEVDISALRQSADGWEAETGKRRLGSGDWEAETASGASYRSTGLILTPPPPQALALLAAGNVHLASMDAELLGQIDYSSTITGIFRIDGKSKIPAPGAVHRPAESLPWIADNRQKGVSQNETVITINSNGDYVQRYWDAAGSGDCGDDFECLVDENELERMQAAVKRIIKPRLDDVRYYFLCGACQKRIETTAAGVEVVARVDVIVV